MIESANVNTDEDEAGESGSSDAIADARKALRSLYLHMPEPAADSIADRIELALTNIQRREMRRRVRNAAERKDSRDEIKRLKLRIAELELMRRQAIHPHPFDDPALQEPDIR